MDDVVWWKMLVGSGWIAASWGSWVAAQEAGSRVRLKGYI